MKKKFLERWHKAYRFLSLAAMLIGFTTGYLVGNYYNYPMAGAWIGVVIAFFIFAVIDSRIERIRGNMWLEEQGIDPKK